MCEICLGQACHALRRRGQALSQGPAVLTGPSGGAPHRWWGFCTIRSLPSACRRRVAPLMVQFPRLVVWSRFEVVSRPTCRPPRRKTPTMGSRGRGRLRWQHNDAWPRASLAHSPLRCERDPAIACANQLFRTSTRYSVSGRGCPRSHQRVNVRMRRPRRGLAGPRARRGAQAASAPRRTAPLTLSVRTRPSVRPHVRPHAGHVGVFMPPR